MKKQFSFKLLYFIIFSLAFSCSDNNVSDIDAQAQTDLLKKNIIGRWAFDGSQLRTTGANSFVEFLSNGTYTFSQGTTTLQTDKYTVKDQGQVVLDNLGTLTNIKLSGENLNFTLLQGNKTVAISSQREAVLTQEEKMRLLCRKWEMTREENGADSLVYLIGSWVTYSRDGTYFTELMADSYPAPSMSSIQNWKWHSTLPDRIVCWGPYQEAKEDENYIIIRELTENSLRFTQKTYYGFGNFSFVPGK